MIIILIIALVITVAGATLKKEYQIVRAITINRSKQEVFNYIKFLKNQNEYSYYNRKDPETIKSYTGTDGEIGFTYAWKSEVNSIGSGTQTISKLIDGQELECDIQFKKPLPLKCVAVIALTEINDFETEVIWTFSSVYPFPLNIIIYFVNLEKLIGNDIASSLVTLKQNLEQS